MKAVTRRQVLHAGAGTPVGLVGIVQRGFALDAPKSRRLVPLPVAYGLLHK